MFHRLDRHHITRWNWHGPALIPSGLIKSVSRINGYSLRNNVNSIDFGHSLSITAQLSLTRKSIATLAFYWITKALQWPIYTRHNMMLLSPLLLLLLLPLLLLLETFHFQHETNAVFLPRIFSTLLFCALIFAAAR